MNRLCIHTITTRPWTIEVAVKKYSQAGVAGISVWREAVANGNLGAARRLIQDAGLTPVSLCRGGFFPGHTKKERVQAIADNKGALDEAAELGAPVVVLVCGAVAGQPQAVSRDQIRDGIGALLEHAAANKVKLAIEPLHPMYADSRSAINTLRQANDMAEEISSEWVGVVVDVYHLWWDPELEHQIHRCGQMRKLFGFHVCDWRTPTQDLLNDRGLMGEGCIPIGGIRGWMQAAGFEGYDEVEIFSTRYWQQDQDTYLARIVAAYQELFG